MKLVILFTKKFLYITDIYSQTNQQKNISEMFFSLQKPFKKCLINESNSFLLIKKKQFLLKLCNSIMAQFKNEFKRKKLQAISNS